nr:SurA N-terminal domain-containing protein [Sphingopyxis sp. BSNA05]
MKIFRDPITHFVLIGLALVAINHFWTVWQGEQGRTIVVSAAEIDRLEKIWAGTAGRLPTGEDRQQIIDQYVQEEVLVREAGRLGLGEGDTIIRRRLAQKMDFLVGDAAAADDPTDAELERWFNDHRDRFSAPEMRSFTHVYFSPENTDQESNLQPKPHSYGCYPGQTGNRSAIRSSRSAAMPRCPSGKSGGCSDRNLPRPYSNWTPKHGARRSAPPSACIWSGSRPSTIPPRRALNRSAPKFWPPGRTSSAAMRNGTRWTI